MICIIRLGKDTVLYIKILWKLVRGKPINSIKVRKQSYFVGN